MVLPSKTMCGSTSKTLGKKEKYYVLIPKLKKSRLMILPEEE